MADKDPKVDPIVEDKGDSSNKGDNPPAGDKQPTVEELLKKNEDLNTQVSNMKGTQTAIQKNYDEAILGLKTMTETLKKSGIEDVSSIDSIVSTSERNSVLVKVIASEGVSGDLIPFIQGNTEDEMKASVASIKAAIEKQVEALKPVATKVPLNKQPEKKAPKVSDADAAKAFLEKKKFLKTSK